MSGPKLTDAEKAKLWDEHKAKSDRYLRDEMLISALIKALEKAMKGGMWKHDLHRGFRDAIRADREANQ